MNIAVIFAGGVGLRMNNKAKPKQFLELYGKPIIIYTIEHFEQHEDIDGIVIACVEEWIPYLEKLLTKFNISKVVEIVPGGSNGQESIYNGLLCAKKHYPEESIVMIHDGVRPLIDGDIISKNISSVKTFGTAITSAPPVETFVLIDENSAVCDVHDRSLSRLAKAPQSFYLKDILKVHEQAIKDCFYGAIDSCSLMTHYGYKIQLIEGLSENIKITTPTDYYIFKGIIDAKEEMDIFGS